MRTVLYLYHELKLSSSKWFYIISVAFCSYILDFSKLFDDNGNFCLLTLLLTTVKNKYT